MKSFPFALCLVVMTSIISNAHAVEMSSAERNFCSRQCGPPPQVILVPAGQADLDMTCDEQACQVQITVFTGINTGVTSEALVGKAFAIYRFLDGRKVAVPRHLEALKERNSRLWELELRRQAIELTLENLGRLIDPSWSASRTKFDSKTGEYGLKVKWQEVKTSVRYTKPTTQVTEVEVLYAPRPGRSPASEPALVCDCKLYWGAVPPVDKPHFRVKRGE